jgi:hypothetical protein
MSFYLASCDCKVRQFAAACEKLSVHDAACALKRASNITGAVVVKCVH